MQSEKRAQCGVRTLVIPIETITRELDAKVLLALRATMRGWRVVLGGRSNINLYLPHLPSGSLYLAKSLRTGDKFVLRLLDGMGHVSVALDEESLIRHSDEALLMMLDRETFSLARLLFAWGKSDADVWRRFSGYRGTPIIEIGNPRVDLLRPEFAGYFRDEVESIRRRFGNFVLLSTNFSMVNHFIAGRVRFKTAEGADEGRADQLRSGLKAHKQSVFDAFVSAIPAIAKAIEPMKLVIRPHPSENPETWKKLGAGLPNVAVLHEGPIGPWLIAARALIQNGCTSAVEAGVVGTPALAFRPHISNDFEVELSNRVSIDCRSLEELLAALRMLPPKGQLPAHQLDYLRQHIASIDGAFSHSRLLDALEEHGSHLVRAPRSLLTVLRTRLAHFLRFPLRDAFKSLSYRAHKFPGLPQDAVEERVARLRAAWPDIPAVSVTPLAAGIHEIFMGGRRPPAA